MGGSSAPVANQSNPALSSAQTFGQLKSDPRLQSLMNQYSQGGLSLSDALGQAGQLKTTSSNADQKAKLQQQIASLDRPDSLFGNSNQATVNDLKQQLASLPDSIQGDADYSAALRDLISTDGITGSRLASDAVRSDPLTSGLFGQGGIQDQSQGLFGKLDQNVDEDRQALLGRDSSYGLTPEDLQAYGQGSANIARLFGSQEQNLSQSLADRGFGSAGSGVAGAAFSGLQGNKNEQLAGLQMQIAQSRINTAQQLAQARTTADLNRQAQNNSLMQGLGQLGQSALSNQYNRQLAGSEDQYNKQAGLAGLAMNNQQLQQNVNNSQWAQQQESSFNPLSLLGGVVSGGVGALTGAVGKNLGNSLIKPAVTPSNTTVGS